MEKKVSVIVPVFNRMNLLGRCLDSIAAQGWRPLELIVVDDGSSDGSLTVAHDRALCHSSADFTVKVVDEPHRGACHARNRGLSEATGDLCVFFDSDDVMRSDLIEKGVAEFEKHPGLSVACWKCAITLIDGSVRIPPFDTRNPLESHLIHSLLRTTGYMASRELLIEVGGWDDSLGCWNDLELGVRILLHIMDGTGRNGHPGKRIAGIPEVLAHVYSQKDSITGDSFSSKAGKWEMAIDRIRHDIQKSDFRDKNRLLKILAYRMMILAAHYKNENRSDLASDLFERMMGENGLTGIQKTVFKMLYHYTARGGRGAWRIARPFLLHSH